MSNENARAILKSKNALRGGDVVLKSRLWFLNDADVEAVLDEDVVNTFPAGAVCPGTVDQNNVPNGEWCSLREERGAGR